MLHGKGWLGVDNEFPLNLCDWATVATVVTLFWPNQRTYELAYFWALAGTLQGMLTPDVQYDFPDTTFLLFFVFHGGIIAGVLYLTFGLKMRPYLQHLPRVIAWSFVYMGVAGLFDWLAVPYRVLGSDARAPRSVASPVGAGPPAIFYDLRPRDEQSELNDRGRYAWSVCTMPAWASASPRRAA